MSLTVPVTQNSTLISQTGFDETVTIYNNGANTVWMDDDSGVNVGNSFPLRTGATRTWEARRPLWARTDTGLTSQLNIGPSGILTDPAAIADELILSGLAQDIADAITINGVPPIDNPESLYSFIGAPTNLAFTVPVTPVECRKYASLLLRWTSYYNGPTQAQQWPRSCTIQWWIEITPGSGTFERIAQDACIFSDDISDGTVTGRLSRLWVPCKGTHFTILVGATTGGLTQTVRFKVFGSYRTPLESEQYLNCTSWPEVASAAWVSDISYGVDRCSSVGFQAVAAATTVKVPINNYAGDSSLCCVNFTAATVIGVWLEDIYGGRRILPGLGTANMQSVITGLMVPRRPFYLTIRTPAAGAVTAFQIFASLTQ